MKFLYKIWSGYDGFQPLKIPSRLQLGGKFLDLGWQRYIDSVNIGDEVWVYFYGPHRYSPGVYIFGFVTEVDPDNYTVRMRVRRFQTDRPLTDTDTSARIGQTVSVRNRQVFLFPENWDAEPECTFNTIADSCRRKQCDHCPAWRDLPFIEANDIGLPRRLEHSAIAAYSPAFWVIPSRCYLYRLGSVTRKIQQTSSAFYRFKIGAGELAYPLALGIYTALIKRNAIDFDAVVPIPLSPDKEARGEIHRTRLLGRELAHLLGTKVAEILSLNRAISKHRLRIQNGLNAQQFETLYANALTVNPKIANYNRILLIDDVCTEGSTLRCAVARLLAEHPTLEIAVATAGQMIVKHIVKDASEMLN